MGEAHSFVSFFASFFLKQKADFIFTKALSVLCFIEVVSCIAIYFRLYLSGRRKAEAGSAEVQPSQEYFRPSVHVCSLT